MYGDKFFGQKQRRAHRRRHTDTDRDRDRHFSMPTTQFRLSTVVHVCGCCSGLGKTFLFRGSPVMSRTAAVAAAVGVVSSVGTPLTGERDLSAYTFEQHLAAHGKQYSGAELPFRAGVFAANLAQMKAVNARPDQSWFAAPNQFSDLTHAEFRAYVKGSGVGPILSGAERPPAFEGDLPPSVDWRQTEGVVTAVKNQGQCGSCWAFSATETMESLYALATGETAPILAPQQLVSCMSNPNDCGGTGGCGGATQPLASGCVLKLSQSPGSNFSSADLVF